MVQLVLCVDLSLCSFSCCELLGFCCRAISWRGSSVFCIAGVKDRFKDFPGAQFDFSRIPKAKPLVQGLDVDDRGNVWVRRTTADTSKTTIDVFDRNGRLIAVTEIPFRLSSYQPLVFRDGFVYAISRDEDDVPFVVREKIGRPRGER